MDRRTKREEKLIKQAMQQLTKEKIELQIGKEVIKRLIEREVGRLITSLQGEKRGCQEAE